MANSRLLLLIWLCLSTSAPAQAPAGLRLTVTIADETGVPVPAALVMIEGGASYKGETDHTGRRVFDGLAPGLYRLRIEKKGYYAALVEGLRLGGDESVALTLNHEQELRESIDVSPSAPAIDPSQTAASERLTNREIINIPRSTTRDYRYVLPFIPGVVRDAQEQVHINGAAAYQALDLFDGFNITHPSSGLLELRVSSDGLRAIDVLESRYSAEYGKGSGGVINLATGMGDDPFRFLATDFIPSVQNRRGVNLDGWTPRFTFSGPLRRGRAWFFDALDAEYKQNIIEELTAGADRSQTWRVNNLIKAQVNLNQTNILTGSFLVNGFHIDHAGISRFAPRETTREISQSAYLFTLREQSYLAGGAMLEAGFAFNQYRTDERPLGDATYVVYPEGRGGNYFRTSESLARRLQWIAALTLAPARWRGRHDFRFGIDLNQLTFRQAAERQMVEVRRADATLARASAFENRPPYRRGNFEAALYAQDRWALSARWLLELGLRLDRDTIIGQTALSPRFAATYLASPDGTSKLSCGVGIYRDATNLEILTQPEAGARRDRFYARDGISPRAEVETSFLVDEGALGVPRFINWSASYERKLPREVYLQVDFIERRGRRGLVYLDQFEPGRNLFVLRSARRDRYDGLQLTARRVLRETGSILFSYTRSSARSNAVFEVGLENPVYGRQGEGPLAWDAPHRLISWGWVPFSLPWIKSLVLSYTVEWRSGYPYSLVNEEQQRVGPPNGQRLPTYFSANLHAEKRLRWFGFEWAVRAGFNNLTDRRNPTEINNNIDSPEFGARGGVQGRSFTGRIRFLGRK
jgi:hypothetical protein